MNSPCMDCPDRQLYCHGKCERYAEYKERMAEIYKDRAARRDAILARNASFDKWERKRLNAEKRKR